MSRFTLAIAITVSIAAQSVVANDFSNVSSGLLLGIYANPSQGGMRVSGTIPGYSAEGRLFPGDILMRATLDGWKMYNLRSHYEMESTKMAIGAGREAALEIWRPGHGMIYAWVEFTPIYGPAVAYSSMGQPQPRASTRQSNKAKATFRMESEKGGARQMFQKNGNTRQTLKPAITNPVSRTGRPVIRNIRKAADLFNR